ncbi:MAG: DUF2141 domain-containing protein [Deltaproteobacteria bacterium]|nr:DUF2141 domain-containing protein [Deltaproteobacteria bacterium]
MTLSIRLVVLAGFRSAEGRLGCKLFARPDGFPEGEAERRVAPIVEAKGTCRFEQVRAGTFAVAVMHDQNANDKLDKNFFGVPTEGYGVSGNKTHALSAPTWEESKFTLEAGETKVLQVSLRY